MGQSQQVHFPVTKSPLIGERMSLHHLGIFPYLPRENHSSLKEANPSNLRGVTGTANLLPGTTRIRKQVSDSLTSFYLMNCWSLCFLSSSLTFYSQYRSHSKPLKLCQIISVFSQSPCLGFPFHAKQQLLIRPL